MERKTAIIKCMALVALMMSMMSMVSYAGIWQQDARGWRYQNEEGAYLVSTWSWIDEKSYCFAANGYLYTDTVTPDGYTVDANGAWILDGVLQVQNSKAPVVYVKPEIMSCFGATYEHLIGKFGTPTYDSGYGDFWTRMIRYENLNLGFEVLKESGKVWMMYGQCDSIFSGMTNAAFTPDEFIVAAQITGEIDTYVSEGGGDFSMGEEGEIVVNFVKDGRSYSIVLIDGLITSQSSVGIYKF